MQNVLQLYLRNHDFRSNPQIQDSNAEKSSEAIQRPKAEPLTKIVKAFSNAVPSLKSPS